MASAAACVASAHTRPRRTASDERRFVDDVERVTGVPVSRLDGNLLLPLAAGFPKVMNRSRGRMRHATGLLRRIAADIEQATATALAGEGGDELLLGQVFSVAARLSRSDSAGVAREIRTFSDPDGTYKVIHGLLDGQYDSVGARMMRALGEVPSWLTATYVSDTGIVDRLAAGYPYLGAPGHLAMSYSREVLAEMGAAGRVRCGGWHEDVGRKAGIKITHPFVDPDLAALMLRDALSDLLPMSVAQRTDQAEALAMSHAGLVEEIDTVRETAYGGPLADHGVIHPDRLLAAVDRYLAGDHALAPGLWATTFVNRWLRHNRRPMREGCSHDRRWG